jgi:hypothetical protein
MHLMLYILALLVAVAAASCGTPNPADWSVDVERLESPAARSSSEPQLAVSDRGVLLSWIERDGNSTVLKYAERTGAEWTQPLTAASGTDWFLSYADVPSVMRKKNGTLVAQWLKTTEAKFEGYDLLLSYSNDNGRTWAQPFTPHHDGTKFQHGFASFIELPGDGLGVVWLDGRNSEYFDNDPASGTMTLHYAAYDAQWKQTADSEIDHNVCECCSTAAVVTGEGALVAYRDRTDKEIRDIAASRLENGKWTPGTIVHNDNWEIYACPVNGPALSARGRQAVVTWFTVKNDQGQAYAAFSTDAGRSWGTPIRLDDGGSLGRVDVELLDDGTAVASWVEYRKESSELRLRLIDPSGARSAPVTVAGVGGATSSGFPRMARDGDQLVFAWSASPGPGGGDENLQVFTALAALP